MNLRLNIIFLFLLLGTVQLFAQETREDIEKQADSYFNKEQFIEATPLYLRLLSLEPRNPSYNYRYGTCLLYNSDEKKSAFKYLNYAVQKSKEVDNEAYFYLGKAYHLTFQFDKAIKYYKIYKEKAGSRVVARLDVDRQIQMCKNGKSLLSNINDVIVLNKTKIDKKSFFRIYNLKDIGGEILVTEEFQTKNDKKKDHTPIIHFPSNSKRVYYSSYGDSDNKDIYVRTRLPDGKWSLAQSVFGKVNTPYDEDYPYMDRQNNYLYFSSKGHNSMGGFDIFRSKYNPENNTFGEPENMDIPISSPDNDFLYIVDSLGRHAYFASQRESKSDNIDVYNIRVERIPVHWVILKGQFTSTIDPMEKLLSMHVDNNSGASIGDFKTSSKGDYLIVLPKGGKYKFTMKVGKKDKEYSQFVEVPYLEKVRPLKQRITQTTEEDSSIVVIENLFDEPFEDADAIIAQALEIKSKLEVNKKQFDLDSLDQLRDEKIALNKVGLSGFTNTEIVALVQSKAEQLSSRNKTSEVLINKAKTNLVRGNEETEKHLNKADSLVNQARNSNNKKTAEKLTRLAQGEIQKAKELQDDVQETKNVLDSLIVDKEKNTKNLNEANQLNSDLKNVDTKNENAFVSALGKHKEFVNNELLKETHSNAGEDYIAQIDKQLGNQGELIERQDKLKKDSLKTQKEVDRLKDEYENTNRKKQKESISLELSQSENELESIKSALSYVDKQIEKQEDIKSKKKRIALIIAGDVQENLPDSKAIQQQSNSLNNNRDRVEKENNAFAAENGIDLAKEPIAQSEEDKEVKVFTSEELLEKADPEYEKDIEELNKAVRSGEKSKEDVVKRIRKAVIQIDDMTSTMMKKKEAYPDSKQIDKNIEELAQLKGQLQLQIEDLNQVIVTENELAKVPEDEQETEQQEDFETPNEENQIENSDTVEIDAHQDTNEDDIAINNQEKNHQENTDNSNENKEPENTTNKVVDEHQNTNENAIENTDSTSEDNKEESNEDDSVDEHPIATEENQEISDSEKVDNQENFSTEDTQKEEQRPKNKTPKIENTDTQPEKVGPSEEKFNLYAANEQQKEQINELNETKNQLLDKEKKNPELVKSKKHQKEVANVEEQIVQQNNDILDTAIESMKSNPSNSKPSNKGKEEVNLSLLDAQHSKIEIDNLIQEAQKEKDPEKQRELLKAANDKQQESLATIQEQQSIAQVNHQIDSMIVSNDYKNIDPDKVTITQEDLSHEQIALGVKLVEIKSQINEMKSVLPNAKKKDAARLTQQINELEEIQTQIETKQQQNQEQLSKSVQEKIAINNKGIDVDALDNELSYEDEVSIAQSETYKELFKSSNQLNQKQYELQVKEEQLDAEKNELKQLRNMKGDDAPLSNKDKEGLEKQLNNINETKGEIANLKDEVATQQNNIKTFISEDDGQQEKIENMIARDVAPINDIPSLPVLMTGLITTNDAHAQYSDKNPIPLAAEQPKGLVFRVQIGAFAKPVPNTTFKEFSPISGDVVRPGLVRYMAGYFGERENANAARDKIRTMGYSDAFVVAYCDGERIPVYRAMQLIASGACIPVIKTSENAIVSGNEPQENGGGTFNQELDAYSYNKGKNAAEADVAEAKMGLYYTVQVGVYNTPVSDAQLKNISPLITKRLSNGQIRYSSGIFNSIIEAKPKQNDAIDRGITDAFITAYYQGKRIPLGEARDLIDGKGEQVLELKNPTVTQRNKVINRTVPESLNEEKEPFLANKKIQSMLVSKLTFISYPTQVLNRYNADGQLFYYDSISQHIKSFVFEGSYTEPPFKDDFDSKEIFNDVYPVISKNGFKRKEAIGDYDKNAIVLKVNITATDLNPDLMRTIFNAPFNKTMSTSKSGITVKFYVIQSQKGDALINHLQVLLAQFGATDILKSIRQFDEN